MSQWSGRGVTIRDREGYGEGRGGGRIAPEDPGLVEEDGRCATPQR